jgi:acetylglutamate kinase
MSKQQKRVVIIKIGGQVVDNPSVLQSVVEQIALLLNNQELNVYGVIVVHGGGAIATRISKELGVESTMIQGRRITSEQMRDVCVMVYRGVVNSSVVASFHRYTSCQAVGVSGADGACILAAKRPPVEMSGTLIDFGFVGDIQTVCADFFSSLLGHAYIPVVAPLSMTEDGVLLNTNADTIAQEIAVALAPEYQVELWYCFEKHGVLRDVQDPYSVIASINLQEYQTLKSTGVIADGMIPKLDNAFRAIERGVQLVRICRAEDITIDRNALFGTVIQKEI